MTHMKWPNIFWKNKKVFNTCNCDNCIIESDSDGSKYYVLNIREDLSSVLLFFCPRGMPRGFCIKKGFFLYYLHFIYLRYKIFDW